MDAINDNLPLPKLPAIRSSDGHAGIDANPFRSFDL